MLQLNFKIAPIAGSVNTASDFLSRRELKVTEKIRLKIREDIHTTPFEVKTSSSDVADEEQFFFTHADDTNESEEQTRERKERSTRNAKQWAANEESPVLKTSVKEFTNLDGNTALYSMNGIKANARIRVEQDVDLVLKNLKLKILGQPYDEVLIMTDSRYKNYKANEERIILKDGLLFRKYFGETGSVKYYQILIPKQLVKEVLRSLHGEFCKHPGNYKTIIAYREKNYFPKLAELIREWVISCKQCIRESPVLKTSVKEFTNLDGNTTLYSMNGIKANARIRVEQDVDLVLKNLKLKILGQPYDEVLIMTDPRYKNYKANEERIILKDGLLSRKYFEETGSVKYYQILIPKQLVKEVLRSLHGEFCKHPGIYKTIIAYREKNYFPKLAELIREWVISCKQYIRESLVDRSLTRLPLQIPNEHNTAPEVAMQIDLVPELPLSGGYENIVTAMDVFSRYFFADPTSNQDAKTFAIV